MQQDALATTALKMRDDLINSPSFAPDAPSILDSAISFFLNHDSYDLQTEVLKNDLTEKFSIFAAKSTISNTISIPEFTGYSVGLEDTRWISVIECYERMAAYLFARDSRFVVNKSELKNIYLFDPFGRFVIKKPEIENFLNHKFRVGYSISSDSLIAVDSAYVYGIPDLVKFTNSGTACGFSYNHAINHALFELIERDTLLNNWYSKNPPKAVAGYNSVFFAKVSDIINQFGYSITLFLYQSRFNTPVIICKISNNHQQAPYAFFGFGAGLKFSDSADKAIRECFAIWVFDYFAIKKGMFFENDPANQAKRYYDPIVFQEIAHYFSSPATIFDEDVDHNAIVDLGAIYQDAELVVFPICPFDEQVEI